MKFSPCHVDFQLKIKEFFSNNGYLTYNILLTILNELIKYPVFDNFHNHYREK